MPRIRLPSIQAQVVAVVPGSALITTICAGISGARSAVEAMESISAVVGENTASTEEMAAQAGQVMATIQSISEVAAENSSATERVSGSAQELNDQISRIAGEAEQLAGNSAGLRSLVARFQLEGAVAAPSVAPVAAGRRSDDWSARRAS